MTNERILGIVCSHMSDAPSTRKRPKNLTKRQTAFRDAILAGFNPSDAYRKSFNAKGMSKKAISIEAGRVLRYPHVSLAISQAVRSVTTQTVLPAPPPSALISLQRRMEELAHAALLDPIDAFDELNHYKSIREMPEHIRRCIAGFKIDPVSFVLEVKFIDKRGAIMDYSKLAGDIPKDKDVQPPKRRAFDLSKLTDEEFREHMRLRKKAMVDPGSPA